MSSLWIHIRAMQVIGFVYRLELEPDIRLEVLQLSYSFIAGGSLVSSCLEALCSAHKLNQFLRCMEAPLPDMPKVIILAYRYLSDRSYPPGPYSADPVVVAPDPVLSNQQ